MLNFLLEYLGSYRLDAQKEQCTIENDRVNDQVCEDHTYAIRGSDIGMALDKEGHQALVDPEYAQELLYMINGYTAITIFNMDKDKDFVDPECVKKELSIVENSTGPNSALHNSVVSNGENPSSTSNNRRMKNGKSQHNRKRENGRIGNYPYNLRVLPGRNKNNTR